MLNLLITEFRYVHKKEKYRITESPYYWMMTQKMILQNQDYWMCITRLLNKRRLLKYLLLSLSISKSKNRNWLRTKKLAWTILHIKILKNWISWLLNPYMYTKKNTLLITESRHVHKRKKYWIALITETRHVHKKENTE